VKESLLISKCLLGEKVRYDGGDCKQDNHLLKKLSDKYNLIPICPEVMAGMTTPRDPIEIKNKKVIKASGEDVTPIFEPVFIDLKRIVRENNIHKALLKDFSPSCGSTKVYDGDFSGNKIEGVGIITAFLQSLNLIVYSETEIKKLLD
jgi:uncharacterized protein YbbK (DUF523 family)